MVCYGPCGSPTSMRTDRICGIPLRVLALVAIAFTLLTATACGSSSSDSSTSSSEESAEQSQASETTSETEDGPRVGIAWRKDPTSRSYAATELAIREAGGVPVRIGQITLSTLSYGDDGALASECVDEVGYLNTSSAEQVKQASYDDTNIEQELGDIDIVVFAGGADVSPTLYAEPQEWHGIEDLKGYDPERDVSDYLLMNYCIDHDVKVVGICRGEQMLGVVSGASMIQDIATYFDEQGAAYNDGHRAVADGKPTYPAHDVDVREGTILASIYGAGTITGAPSSHHQAIRSVEGTQLEVSATTTVSGIEAIEGVERTDKSFVVGIKFHPEIAVEVAVENAENKGEYMSYDEALVFFKRIVQEAGGGASGGTGGAGGEDASELSPAA